MEQQLRFFFHVLWSVVTYCYSIKRTMCKENNSYTFTCWLENAGSISVIRIFLLHIIVSHYSEVKFEDQKLNSKSKKWNQSRIQVANGNIIRILWQGWDCALSLTDLKKKKPRISRKTGIFINSICWTRACWRF